MNAIQFRSISYFSVVSLRHHVCSTAAVILLREVPDNSRITLDSTRSSTLFRFFIPVPVFQITLKDFYWFVKSTFRKIRHRFVRKQYYENIVEKATKRRWNKRKGRTKWVSFEINIEGPFLELACTTWTADRRFRPSPRRSSSAL